MSEGGETGRYFCHVCRRTVPRNENYTCAECDSGFIEEITRENDSIPNISRNVQDQRLRDLFSDAGGVFVRPPSAHVSNLLETIFSADVREILPGPSITSPLNFSSLPFFEIMYGNVNDYAWGAEGLDAVVTQLLSQFEANGPPPMNKTEIDKLPEVKVTEEQVKTSLECTVCMEEFKLDEKVKQLICQHMFHKECITPWLEMHGTCPICRKLLSNRNEDRAGQAALNRQSNSNNQAAARPTEADRNSGSSSSGLSAPDGNRNSQRQAQYYDYDLEDLD